MNAKPNYIKFIKDGKCVERVIRSNGTDLEVNADELFKNVVLDNSEQNAFDAFAAQIALITGRSLNEKELDYVRSEVCDIRDETEGVRLINKLIDTFDERI